MNSSVIKHAPGNYDCPFCRRAHWLKTNGIGKGSAFVLEEERVFALIPLHYKGNTKGNCLVIPKQHYENIFDIDEALGVDLLRVAKRLSFAMKKAFSCEGVSTRQHNEPAGDQDVWHYHLHVTPRFHADRLYSAPILRYTDVERSALAAALRDSASVKQLDA
jgi:histidine triad (HIT) family protein